MNSETNSEILSNYDKKSLDDEISSQISIDNLDNKAIDNLSKIASNLDDSEIASNNSEKDDNAIDNNEIDKLNYSEINSDNQVEHIVEDSKVQSVKNKKKDKTIVKDFKYYFKNYIAPLIFIVVLPLVLILVLIKINKISPGKILPNKISLIATVVLILYGFLSIKLCSKKFYGPENVDGSKPVYADNGLVFWIVTSVLVSGMCIFKKVTNSLTENFIPIILTFNIIGLLLVSCLYFKDRNDYHDKEKDDAEGTSGLFRFYRGLKFHPKLLGVDIKQWTNCRFGMISWQIIILVLFFYSLHNYGFNIAIFVTVLLQTIYIGKFFWWETGYFNTLDITLDRAGYYICWGCLVFVPAFYTFTTYYLTNKNPQLSLIIGLVILLAGLFFIYKNYEVDKQKEDFKANKENTIINGEKAKYMDVEYEKKEKILGKENEINVKSKLLLSGHWGQARHKNYTYEILLSGCWSAVGYQHGFAPFTYLVYIITLLVHRTIRDEKKCKDKYKNYWNKYCEKVPHRFIKNII